MSEVLVLAARGLVGGALVVAFALVGEMMTPKAFSGLFSAAPSVAVPSLALTVAADGVAKAREETVGMVVGGIVMGACCVVAAAAIPPATRPGGFGGRLGGMERRGPGPLLVGVHRCPLNPATL